MKTQQLHDKEISVYSKKRYMAFNEIPLCSRRPLFDSWLQEEASISDMFAEDS